MLEGEAPLNPEALKNAVGVALRQVNRFEHLVAGLLDVSRLTSGRFELVRSHVDMGQALLEFANQFKEVAAAAGCELRVRSQGSIWMDADLIRLEQVMGNLIVNAIRYAAHHPIEVSIREENRELLFEVADAGPGVSEYERGRIFERFERGSMQGSGGMGLGLYVSREILRAHGGDISVSTSHLGGALFSVKIPIAANPV